MSSLLRVTDPGLPVPIRGMPLPQLYQKLTRDGTCMFREVKIPLHADHAFRASWRQSRRKWLERGYSIRQLNGAWMLSQWLLFQPDKSLTLTKLGQERLDELVSPQAELQLAASVPTYILPELPFGLADKLRGYQIDPARQLYRALTHGRQEWGYPGAFDASDMGTGKTYMDLAAAIATGREVVILCPTVGIAGWQRACDHFGITPLFISTYEAVRGGFRPHIAQEIEGKFTWKHPDKIIIIFDEAQALRHEDTLTVRCCSAAIRQGIPIIMASATVAVSVLEMRFVGRVTGLHAGSEDWERFLANHGCIKARQSWKWDGKAHHLARIHSRLFPSRGARVRKQDLGEECPETIIETLPFRIPEALRIEEQWKEANEMLDRLAAQGMAAAQIKVKERNLRMKIWKESERVLVPHIGERIRADVQDGNSVAVFMNFNETRITLARMLNTSAGFYGGQPLARRQYWEKEFQANRQHVLVSNIAAGGASVSLHDIHGERPRVSYIFPTDHVVKFEQATGRVDRVGGKSLSRQYIPHVAGSISERMVAGLRRKMRNIATLNDGHKASAAKF
ncbi:hypothetical protein WJU23_05320 [Prosthecobacter sp. SYSU 5D2]|uniref:hypothetical protein n=1 Tax=Prosthecobacter sp. SYSU 5D2 TaxID=3134134 RepID=UPI0031FF14F4